jgi:DNA-binding transcriptional ArsR family regulator
MPYPTSPGYVRGSQTSKDAAHSISAGTVRDWVLKRIRFRRSKGATCEELEDALDLRHQTVSARLTELRLMGKVRIIGTRKTRSGRDARVYVATGDEA